MEAVGGNGGGSEVLVRVEGRVVVVRSGDVIGRSPAADLTVADPEVSRKHAQLVRDGDAWVITDLASTNGVHGPDGRAPAVALRVGHNVVHLGDPGQGCRLEIEVEAPPAPEPATVVAERTEWLGAPAADRSGDPFEAVTTAMPQEGPPAPPHRIQSLGSVDWRGPGAGSTSADPAGPASRPAPGGVTVRAEDVTVVVGRGLTILHETTLTIPGGTLTAIIGPSGCGKSTLANLLSGRRNPTTGAVRIEGTPMSDGIRERIGVVPQHDAVHERLTVRRALAAAARLRYPATASSSVIDQAVATTAETLGLSHRLDTRVSELSGGQRKRVSVGYELVADPVMMVLDEPTSGLDPGLEQELIRELRAMADRGTTTVVVTHSDEAAASADLVVVLAPGGRLAFFGTPDEVLAHFGADDWHEVFARLTAENGPRLTELYARSAAHDRHLAAPPPPASGFRPEPHRRSWWRELRVMTGRYVRSILADPRSLLLLAVQAPILGLVFALVLKQNAFTDSLRPSTAGREFVMATVMAMLWIGASNSVREIVKERPTFLRERAVGVAASALVASRWLVLSVITAFQAVVLYTVAAFRQVEPPGPGLVIGDGRIELVLALFLVGLAGIGLGLVLSGAADDVAKAMALLPVLLIPMVLFSGLLIPTDGKPGLEQAGYVNPVQWAGSATAVTADLLDKEGCNPQGLEAELQQLLLGGTISCQNPRWERTRSTQAINFGVAFAQILALCGASFLVTARSTARKR